MQPGHALQRTEVNVDGIVIVRRGIAGIDRRRSGNAPATDCDGQGLEVEGDVRKHQGVVSANLG